MKNKYINRISPIIEELVAFCDKCQTARTLEYKRNKDGSYRVVCSECGYCNPIWDGKG